MKLASLAIMNVRRFGIAAARIAGASRKQKAELKAFADVRVDHAGLAPV
jgi:hypothetical protein